MKYPRIEFHKSYNKWSYSLDYEVPENYEKLIKNIDENFIKKTQNLAKLVLKEFDVVCEYPVFQWNEKRGLHSIYIGDGRRALLLENSLGKNERYFFQNISESWHALALFNIISLYLNKLQDRAR